MITKLLEEEYPIFPEVYQSLQKKFNRLAEEIAEQKAKVLNEQSATPFLERIKSRLHREESISRYILRGMVSDLKITRTALRLLEKKGKSGPLKY